MKTKLNERQKRTIEALRDALKCDRCGRSPREHIWRCLGCDEPLERDADGLPMFEGHGPFAELTCPPPISEVD